MEPTLRNSPYEILPSQSSLSYLLASTFLHPCHTPSTPPPSHAVLTLVWTSPNPQLCICSYLCLGGTSLPIQCLFFLKKLRSPPLMKRSPLGQNHNCPSLFDYSTIALYFNYMFLCLLCSQDYELPEDNYNAQHNIWLIEGAR